MKKTALTLNFETEIIVVDNSSSDGTSEAIKSRFADVKLITRASNNGIAGWNDGFAVAQFEYLLVLDDDSHIYSGLNEAVAYLKATPAVGILALQVVDEQLGWDRHLNPDDAWKDGEQIAGFIGCGAIITKQVYQKIGGFAEWLFVYTHEFEYAIRCLNAGFKVQFFSQGIVVHRVSNINRSNKRLRVFGTRNEMAIIHKYFSADKSKYIYRTLLNNLKFVKREGLSAGYYVFKGYLAYLALKKSIVPTPVSQHVQDYYAERFWSTKPIWTNLRNRFN